MAPILTLDLRLVESVSKEPIPICRYAETPFGVIFEMDKEFSTFPVPTATSDEDSSLE